MEKTFGIGDVVVYKASGVFRIVETGTPDFVWERRQLYYTLKEVHARNPRDTLYVPISSAALMRPVVGREQAEAYLNGFALLEPDPESTSRTAGVTGRYQAMLDACELLQTLRLLKALYLKARLTGRNQKLMEVDIQYLNIAEKVVCDELAYVLGMTPPAVQEELYLSVHRKKARVYADQPFPRESEGV